MHHTRTGNGSRADSRGSGAGHRSFNRLFAAALGGCLVLYAGFNFICDPLMMFHRPWFKPLYSANERYRIPGFARSLDHDTALVGASSAMAIRASDLRATLGGQPVIQVIGGATLAEESLAVEATLRQGRTRRLVWILDPLIFSYAAWRPDIQMPRHLYQGELVGLMRYLLDRTTLSMSLAVIRHVLGGGVASDEFVTDLDALYQLPPPSAYSAASVRQAFHSETALTELNRRERATYVPFDEVRVSTAFDEQVAAVLRRHPEVRFEMVLSPSTTAFYQFLQRHFPRRYDQYMYIRKLAYERLADLPNARLYDLQTDSAITEDYGNFSDMLHFSPAVGQRILAAIRDGAAVNAAAEPAARAAIERSVTQVPLP